MAKKGIHSQFVDWGLAGPTGLSVTLNLAKLHPSLAHIEFERGHRHWTGRVIVNQTPYSVTGKTRFDALAELLNLPALLHALKTSPDQNSRPGD